MINYNKAIVGIPLSIVLAGAVYAGGFYMDKTYIRQDTYRQAQVDNRIWALRDKIQAIKDRANQSGAGLSGFDKSKIQGLENEIKKLGGVP